METVVTCEPGCRDTDPVIYSKSRCVLEHPAR